MATPSFRTLALYLVCLCFTSLTLARPAPAPQVPVDVPGYISAIAAAYNQTLPTDLPSVSVTPVAPLTRPIAPPISPPYPTPTTSTSTPISAGPTAASTGVTNPIILPMPIFHGPIAFNYKQKRQAFPAGTGIPSSNTSTIYGPTATAGPLPGRLLFRKDAAAAPPFPIFRPRDDGEEMYMPTGTAVGTAMMSPTAYAGSIMRRPVFERSVKEASAGSKEKRDEWRKLLVKMAERAKDVAHSWDM